MRSTTKTILVIFTAFSMMLSGCTEATNDSIEDNDITDEIDEMQWIQQQQQQNSLHRCFKFASFWTKINNYVENYANNTKRTL